MLTVTPGHRDGLGTVVALEGNGEGVDEGEEVFVLSKGQGKGVLQVNLVTKPKYASGPTFI